MLMLLLQVSIMAWLSHLPIDRCDHSNTEHHNNKTALIRLYHCRPHDALRVSLNRLTCT